MSGANLEGIVGTPAVNPWQLPDTTARMRTGTVLGFVDPWWGGMRVMYGRAAASIRQYGVCTFLVSAQTGGLRFDMTEVPDTANLGVPIVVAMTSMTVGQFGWFVTQGATPINSAASVAADTAFGIGGVGQGGAVSAGKQILNARNSLAATTTVAKTNVTANAGATVLTVPNAEGWFIGLYLSGTGIAALTVVTGIDPSGTQVTISAATSAAVNGTVTGTYNNATVYYNVAMLNGSFAQGQDAT